MLGEYMQVGHQYKSLHIVFLQKIQIKSYLMLISFCLHQFAKCIQIFKPSIYNSMFMRTKNLNLFPTKDFLSLPPNPKFSLLNRISPWPKSYDSKMIWGLRKLPDCANQGQVRCKAPISIEDQFFSTVQPSCTLLINITFPNFGQVQWIKMNC